ncbi:MAG: TMEM175 family protein, partial [Chitinophagaceae bacterium]
NRVEAFSDGVFAVIITIMVLEMKIPHGSNLADLKQTLPVFLVYILSFIYVGIYWTNHHHLFQVVEKVNGKIMWANLFLLFWLSLFPFVTGWMGENHFETWPSVLYGFVALMNAIAWYMLSHILIADYGKNSALARAYGKDTKGKVSAILYVIGILLSFFLSWLGIIFYTIVAAMWIVPDKRIEREIMKSG